MKTIPKSWVTPIRLIYTIMFNFYAWYWLYKIIWVLPFDWENVASWIIACLGMWFFVLDTNDKDFKEHFKGNKTYPEI